MRKQRGFTRLSKVYGTATLFLGGGTGPPTHALQRAIQTRPQAFCPNGRYGILHQLTITLAVFNLPIHDEEYLSTCGVISMATVGSSICI